MLSGAGRGGRVLQELLGARREELPKRMTAGLRGSKRLLGLTASRNVPRPSRGTLAGLAMLRSRRLLGTLRLCSSVSCPRPRASAKMRVRDALRVQDASEECVTVQVGVWKDCCPSLLGPSLGRAKLEVKGSGEVYT